MGPHADLYRLWCGLHGIESVNACGVEGKTLLAEIDAALLPKVCEVYLKARDERAILPSQAHIIEACDTLMRALAHVGIIAQRLLDHVGGDNSCINGQAPTHFVGVLTDDMDEEEKRLIREYDPVCNKKMG
jgi:hypothetical protein